MDESKLIAIPTQNRDIRTNLEAYARNLNTHGHRAPLLVFDDSDEYYASNNRKAVESLVAIYPFIGYVGKKEKAVFIEQFRGLPQEELAIIFGEGYGGNVNCIFKYSAGKKLVVVDDDTLPLDIRAKIETRFKLRYAVEQRTKVTSSEFDEKVERQEIDFLHRMIQSLGVEAGSLDMRRGYGIDERDSVVEIYGEHPNQNTPVKFSLASMCFDRDLAAITYINEFLEYNDPTSLECKTIRKSLTTHLDPAVVVSLKFRSTSFGIDNSSNILPFMPTGVRGEDLTFRHMLSLLEKVGISYSCVYGVISQPHIKSNVRPTLAQTYLEEELNACFIEKLKEFFTQSRQVTAGRSLYHVMRNLGQDLIPYADTVTANNDDIKGYSYGTIFSASSIAQRLERGCKDEEANRRFVNELGKLFHLKDERGFQLLERDFTRAIRKALKNVGSTMKYWKDIVEARVETPIYFPATIR